MGWDHVRGLWAKWAQISERRWDHTGLEFLRGDVVRSDEMG